MVEGWHKPGKGRVSHYYIQDDQSRYKFTSLCGKHTIVVYGFDVLRQDCPDTGCVDCRRLMAEGNSVGGP